MERRRRRGWDPTTVADVRLSRRSALRLGAMSAAAIGLAACGDDDDDGPSAPATEPTSAPPASASGTATTAGAGATSVPAARVGTLRYATSLGPAGFDPIKQTNSIQNVCVFPIFDRLVHLSPEGTAIPGLAESWEFRDDGRVLRMQLRGGVSFHDGTPFDAEAVRANLERAKTTEGSVAAGDLAGVETVEIVDDHTVDLRLTAPDASLPLKLSDRGGCMVSPAAFDTVDTSPVGTGAFLLDEFQQDVFVRYVAADDHWNASEVHIEALEISVIADGQVMLNGLQTGALDAIPIDPKLIRDAERAGFTVQRYPTTFIDHLWINRSEPPLSDVRVRRALNHAINREGLCEALTDGQDQPAYQLFADGYFAASPDLGEAKYEYDVEKAKTLLAEAGYPDGFDLDVCTVTLPQYVVLTEAVQAMLADVGIRVHVNQLDITQILEEFLEKQSDPAQVGSLTGRADPSQSFSLLFTSGGYLNPGGHSTPEFEEKARIALETLDPAARTIALQEASQQLMVDALAVPLKFPTNAIAMTDKVKAFPMAFSRKPEFTGVVLDG